MAKSVNPRGKGEARDAAQILDVTDEKDRALLRRAVRERWPIPMKGRDKIAKKLVKIASGANKADARAVTSAARTLARMDALNQADEHADRHYERVDEGKATELVKHEGVAFVVPGLPKAR